MARDAGSSSDSKDSSLPKLPSGHHGIPLEVVRQNQRERLLAGAVKAVEERGFAKVAVADILRHSGVSRSAFYTHFFANKEECIEAAFDASLESLVEQEVKQRLGVATVPKRTSGSSDSPEPAKLPSGHHGIPVEVVRQNQRERLLTATPKAVEERGFAKLRVIDIVRHAGVSRRVFYEHFASKEECVEAAFGGLADDVKSLDGSRDPSKPAHPQELVDRYRRQRIITGIAKAVEERGFARVRVADITRHSAVAQETFYKHFANKEECIEAAFGAPLASLVESEGRRRFGVPVTGSHASESSPARLSLDLVQSSPGRLRTLRHPVRRKQRERLLMGTAKAVEERGFAKLTVADILRHAGVSSQIFYEHFANKWQCLEAARGISLIPQNDDGAS
jgi:AcrR family transcriptional regulator